MSPSARAYFTPYIFKFWTPFVFYSILFTRRKQKKIHDCGHDKAKPNNGRF